MPERAACLPRRASLLVADLHLGKGESLRALGGPIPRAVNAALLDEQFDRLERAFTRAGATRVLILGDLLHAAAGLDAALIDAVASRLLCWRDSRGLTVEIVPGNHDRALHRVADSWGVRVLPERIVEPPFAFVHAPPEGESPEPFTWCGHLHPAVTLRRAGDALKLPCFHLKPRLGVLPAFSPFTAGVSLDRDPADRLFAVAGVSVLAV